MKYTLEVEVEKSRDRVAEFSGDADLLLFCLPGFICMDPISGEEGSKVKLL